MGGKKVLSIGPKTLFAVLGLALSVSLFFSDCSRNKAEGNGTKELVIWTYDSFNSEWGPGPELSQLFEDETGIAIRWVNHGDAGAVLSRLLLEGKDAGADIILGLDQNMAEKALSSGLLEGYKPAGADRILPELIIDESYRLIPWDYSYFAINYDSERLPNPPASLEELTRPEYAGKLILMDPRTSSPGLGFLTWTKAIYGDGWQDYWRRLRPSILTIAEGWSSGYGLYTEGEAPLVLSYTTSPGYHLEYESSDRYRAAIFAEGHPIQIEVAGLLGSAKNKGNAKKFLDFMLSDAFQNTAPHTNWMYPVTPVALPDSYRINPKSDKPLRPPAPTDADLNQWAAILSSGQ
ncbi:thiamine-binding periplasmic protein [Treponema primitia ZAS-2]|uniref:Thiamine-binding periplasmic protein n=1 Tax=Treponema primitia (strain ATCC BAA-887 / DSM 12427 / ZAS-2) TaxID=545694 RepID=F5YKZ4_TREPZ|nr:thiamine ABC transporter substrate-binding protein [Treponema primitia]AEF85869.1 thiamine-binding periplasmic protein [Treponema primitia ZAS-2]